MPLSPLPTAYIFPCYSCRTRATVMTSISRAPAWRNTRAHSRTVAPVVKTSSMSKILLPFTRSGRCTAKAPWTLSRRSSGLRPAWGGVGRCRCNSSPFQGNLGKSLGQKQGLVKAPLAQAAGMKGYWHHQISVPGQFQA